MDGISLQSWCYEPAHDKTYNKSYAAREGSDQPAHLRGLICLRWSHCLLQHPGDPKRDGRESLPYWVDVQADLSLSWSHRSYCRICRALAHMFWYLDLPLAWTSKTRLAASCLFNETWFTWQMFCHFITREIFFMTTFFGKNSANPF